MIYLKLNYSVLDIDVFVFNGRVLLLLRARFDLVNVSLTANSDLPAVLTVNDFFGCLIPVHLRHSLLHSIKAI